VGTDPKDSSKQVPTPYDAGESGASNLAPTSKALLDRVKRDVANYGAAPVPADAVTTSGSGLDPDISPQNAYRQAQQVASARSMPVAEVKKLIAAHTEQRLGGVLGAPLVNVLSLNLALDAAPKSTPLAGN
jgi:K+-transporting ATPase ATPase C chain